MENGLSRGLAWWEAADLNPTAALATLIAHPALGRAVKMLAANMLEVAARDRVLDSLFKDAGRYVAAMWALYLHDTGGLTLARLKEVCARSGLLSPGRARALLLFLEHLGFVERAAARGGAALYAPTALFRQAWAAQLRAALEAGRVLEPELDLVLMRGGAGVLETFGRIHAEGLLQSIGGEAPIPEFLTVFMHAHAGNQIIWSLLMTVEGEAFPPERAGPISASALSRSFGVSRVHVNRLFAEADRTGLARMHRDGTVRFEPSAREQMAYLYAAQFMQILAAAAKSARAHGLVAAPWRPPPRVEIPAKMYVVTLNSGA